MADDRQMLNLLLRGFQVSRMLRLVADLGIADRTPPDRSADAQDLAASCGLQAQALTRVLRALAAFGIFTLTPDGSVGHTPRSLLLRSDAEDSLHFAARFWTTPGAWQAWGQLDAALHGEVPHEAAWGMSRFDHLEANPDEARVYDAMMAHFPDDRHAAIAASYDFSSARLIADIGGGDGTTLRHILSHAPQAAGLVFDREDVICAAHPEARIALHAGSFFDAVPAGADIYLLIRVLHNWPDEACLRILRVCRAAMDTHARLLLGEQLLEPDPLAGRPTDYLLDVQMMVMFGGARSRTQPEFASLLDAAGLALRRVIATPSPLSIVEAVPA